MLVPFALGYMVWLSSADQATAWSSGPGHLALLAVTGVITAAPLLCFAGAANRISLTTLGLLAVPRADHPARARGDLFDEPMGTQRWIGFSLVWLALAIFTFESIAHRRRTMPQSSRSRSRTEYCRLSSTQSGFTDVMSALHAAS